ncbi:lysine N(6)-hydroxylase/L-ornithine N(5)-oxygenase family protein [Nonomuraea sp. NPDC050394]|uniref:lysine N(6)-hydroxylase/L-ornithine N(5)-oxygenase family protein n=1 Tax=Nonomuraea sp. NPDC050394 TaxID=3364363 RepID=UPI003795ED2B
MHGCESETVLDVLGIGFGPSNLALAIALEEHTAAPPLTSRFLERQPRFGWHRGILIDDATMQVSFPKDLVTMRDPRSDFSFLYYLREKGRLVDFVNQKTLFPLRAEFHDYFEWAAGRLSHLTQYSAEVVAVEPVHERGEVRAFDVVTGHDGHRVRRRARNLSIAMGLKPHLPPGTVLSDRVWHTSEVLPRIARRLESGEPVRRALVLGAGQSAAEVVGLLHRTFTEAEVCGVFGKFGYTPADDSPFANRVFDPAAVDVFFGAPPEVKRSILDYHRGTNYSVVDIDLIQSLSSTMYRERLHGRQRLRMLNVSRVHDVREHAGGLEVTVEDLPTGRREILAADVLVHATGYRPHDPAALLGEAAKFCLRDEEDALRMHRDHRIVLAPQVKAGIYLQGATEHTHGLTSTLLSTVAVRAGEIRDSLLARRSPASSS